MLNITIELVGKAPLLQHNGRLANPLDPITQQIAALVKKRNKTPEDYRILFPLEAYGGTYETPEGLLGMPTENVHSCLVKAAAGFKQGRDLNSALLFRAGEVTPLLVASRTVDAKEYIYSDSNHMFIRTVVVARRRTLRSRPIIHNWSTMHRFTLLDDIVNPSDLKKIFDRAGRQVGMGDWHPRYGTFITRVVSTEAIAEEEAA